jgi:hypothetical protein
MAAVVAIGVVVVVLLVVVVVVARRRGRSGTDDIASFRRQIDALSPDARRPTIDQMKPPDDRPADDDGDP